MLSLVHRPPLSPLFPYTTLYRSMLVLRGEQLVQIPHDQLLELAAHQRHGDLDLPLQRLDRLLSLGDRLARTGDHAPAAGGLAAGRPGEAVPAAGAAVRGPDPAER